MFMFMHQVYISPHYFPGSILALKIENNVYKKKKMKPTGVKVYQRTKNQQINVL